MTEKPGRQIIPSLPLEPNKTLLQSSHCHLHTQSLLSSSKDYHLQSDGDDDDKNTYNIDIKCTSSNSTIDYDDDEEEAAILPEDDHSSGHDMNVEEEEAADCGRERLKRHRIEVAGRVWIPEIWGKEEFLKDWIDCSAFDVPLMPNRIISARAALAEEGRRATSARLRIENRC